MSERLYDCPQCGAPVKFQSSVAVFAVCGHCRSMVVARDANVETLGVMAELPPDVSPFQVGTRGEWNGMGFEIVGRIRVTWGQGSWNEWCLMCGGQTVGWLAEAQGLLMISIASDVPGSSLPNRDSCQPGQAFNIDGKRWTVTDVKIATCLASEGELPFMATPASTRLGVDLVAEGGHFASLEFDENGARLFVGDFVGFGDLKFQNLRPVPGWSAEVDQERNRTNALQCPHCGAAVNLRAVGLTMSAVCGSCGSVIDTANPQLQLVQAADAAKSKMKPLIQIGTRGNFRGVDWEVIGLCNRKDQWARWAEYLLFNPWLGFRWLVTFEGHWSFVDRLPTMGNLSGMSISVGERDYRLFATATAAVTGVIGEFYWKIERGECANLFDYISPPFILSKEVYPDLKEFTWSHGEYVEPSEIAASFGLKEPTTPSGIYLNQPNPYDSKWDSVKWWWFCSVLAVLCIQLFFIAAPGEREATSASLTFDRGEQTAAVVSPEQPAAEAEPNLQVTTRFPLDGGTSRVGLEVEAPVDNNWVGASVELVNAATNEHFPAEIEVGYYHGSDGGSWSEGSRKETVFIPAVPPGEYFLTVEMSADPSVRRMPLNVRVVRGGLFWSNFLLMLGLVCVYPVSVAFRRNRFERSRWSESDYNPYASSDEDNE